MTQKLTGPDLPPLSGQARQLVVFLHGYGADGNDLIDLGQQWRELLPEAAFISPHAPEPCTMSPMGRQWFSLQRRDPQELWNGVNQAESGLNAFLDEQLARWDVAPQRLALVGFSQGTMMALHIGLRRAILPGAILGYSGLLAGPEHLSTLPKALLPILLVHGDQDQVIPVEAMFQAATELSLAGKPCQWHLSAGTGHGLDRGGLQHGGLFLQQALTQSA